MNEYRITLGNGLSTVTIEADGFFVDDNGAHFFKGAKQGEQLATFAIYSHITKRTKCQ
jgi:hypothetical protein